MSGQKKRPPPPRRSVARYSGWSRSFPADRDWRKHASARRQRPAPASARWGAAMPNLFDVRSVRTRCVDERDLWLAGARESVLTVVDLSFEVDGAAYHTACWAPTHGPGQYRPSSAPCHRPDSWKQPPPAGKPPTVQWSLCRRWSSRGDGEGPRVTRRAAHTRHRSPEQPWITAQSTTQPVRPRQRRSALRRSAISTSRSPCRRQWRGSWRPWTRRSTCS